jgi:hypothetical protein
MPRAAVPWPCAVRGPWACCTEGSGRSDLDDRGAAQRMHAADGTCMRKRRRAHNYGAPDRSIHPAHVRISERVCACTRPDTRSMDHRQACIARSAGRPMAQQELVNACMTVPHLHVVVRRAAPPLSPSLTMHMHAWVGYPIHARGPSSLSVSQIRHLGLGLRA